MLPSCSCSTLRALSRHSLPNKLQRKSLFHLSVKSHTLRASSLSTSATPISSTNNSNNSNNNNSNSNNSNSNNSLLLCGGLFSLFASSDNPDDKAKKAQELIFQNKVEDAIKLLEQVQKSHPAHQGSAQLAMLLAEDTRNAKRVFEIVDAALALNPPPLFYAMFLSARGGCHASLGDITKAKEDLQKALEIFPDSDSALSQLIVLHISQHQFQEAHALAEQALSKKFPMSIMMGCQAKVELHLLEALEYSKRAYELDNNPMTRQQYLTLKQFTQK